MTDPQQQQQQPHDDQTDEEEEDDARFEQSYYWDKFNEKDLDFYDWYSSEEFLLDNVKRLSNGNRDVSLLDVGTGTCPLLFTLAKQEGFSNLHGIDFSSTAIEFLKEQAENEEVSIDYRCMDAKDMTELEAESFDLIIDKGCLDCFVNGADSRKWIPTYLSGLRRLLKPDGKLLLIEVADADVIGILDTGSVRRDGEVSVALEKLEGAPFFTVEELRAREEKHMYICKRVSPDLSDQQPRDYSLLSVRCDDCEREYPRDKLPVRCGRCSNKLRRFFMS